MAKYKVNRGDGTVNADGSTSSASGTGRSAVQYWMVNAHNGESDPLSGINTLQPRGNQKGITLSDGTNTVTMYIETADDGTTYARFDSPVWADGTVVSSADVVAYGDASDISNGFKPLQIYQNGTLLAEYDGTTTTTVGIETTSGASAWKDISDKPDWVGALSTYNYSSYVRVDLSGALNVKNFLRVQLGSIFYDSVECRNELSADNDVFFHSNLYVSGDIECDGTVSDSSDSRLKANITPLVSRGRVRPVTFTRVDRVDQDRQYIGFIAQEVEDKYPELVTTGKDGYKRLNYAAYTAVLQAQIDDLEARVSHLEDLCLRLVEKANFE